MLRREGSIFFLCGGLRGVSVSNFLMAESFSSAKTPVDLLFFLSSGDINLRLPFRCLSENTHRCSDTRHWVQYFLSISLA